MSRLEQLPKGYRFIGGPKFEMGDKVHWLVPPKRSWKTYTVTYVTEYEHDFHGTCYHIRLDGTEKDYPSYQFGLTDECFREKRLNNLLNKKK